MQIKFFQRKEKKVIGLVGRMFEYFHKKGRGGLIRILWGFLILTRTQSYKTLIIVSVILQ